MSTTVNRPRPGGPAALRLALLFFLAGAAQVGVLARPAASAEAVPPRSTEAGLRAVIDRLAQPSGAVAWDFALVSGSPRAPPLQPDQQEASAAAYGSEPMARKPDAARRLKADGAWDGGSGLTTRPRRSTTGCQQHSKRDAGGPRIAILTVFIIKEEQQQAAALQSQGRPWLTWLQDGVQSVFGAKQVLPGFVVESFSNKFK